MTEQSPEVVAAADLSPLSPSPLHTSSPAVLFNLQDRADTLDVASLHSFPPATHAAMASRPEAPGVSDTIVVGGDYSDDSQAMSGADDDSFDAYSEADDEQAQRNQPADGGNDDYAKTFDSPVEAQGENGPENEPADEPADGPADEPAPRPDVSGASESLNSFSAPDNLKSQSPAAVPSSAPAPTQQPAPFSHSSPTPESSRPGSFDQENASSIERSTEPSAEPSIAAAATLSAPGPADDNSADSAAAGEEPAPTSAGDGGNSSVDIQKLVDDITARAETVPNAMPPASKPTPPIPQPLSSSSLNVSYPTTLPPKPAVAHQAGQPNARPQDFHPFQAQTSHSHPGPPPPGLPGRNSAAAQALPHGTYMAAAPPGTSGDTISSLPPPPPLSASFNGPQPFASLSHSQPTTRTGGINPPNGHPPHQSLQNWDQFLADEKRYMTEAKWESFPEGSRIFIGNLSIERVSKHEVFDVFHRFGRLAQISLKNAYGFVQYHNVADAQAAMQSAQGAELGGRKIHLEFSRMKKKEDKDRSPDRRNQRGRGTDRYDGRDKGRRGRDDYRPGRSPSPRRDDTYRGDRNSFSSYDRNSRGRSRSPQRHGRYEGDHQYRRRSPSPRRHGHSDGDSLDLPRRYGEQVPDVQLLLMQEVDREFVSWVQRAFYDRGLRSDVMFLNPRFPRDAVLQRQVVEGVHGVIELDVRAQTLGKIPLQVFDRSAGINNVRFDQYQDLDPKIAAELVYRAKTQAAAQPPQPAPPSYPPNPYGQPFPYPAQPAGYPYQAPPPMPPAGPPQQVPAPTQDIASLVGQLDNTALQALLASLQATQNTAAPGGVRPHPQIDVNALLSTIRAAPPAAPAIPPALTGTYGVNPAYPVAGGPNPAVATGPRTGETDTAQQVQNIMATLSQYRQ